MNHIYRSIWNFALGCWVAVPETAKHGGQPTSSSQTASPSWVPDEAPCLHQKKTFKPLAVAVAVSLVLQTVITPYALAQTYFNYEGDLAFGNNTAYSADPIVPPSSTSIWDLGADNLGVGVVTQSTGPYAYGLLAVGSGAVLKAPFIFIGHANKGAFPPDSNRVASGSLIILGALEAMTVEVGEDGGSGVFVVHEGGYANLTGLQLGTGGDAVGTISGTGSVPVTNGGWTLKTQQATVGSTSIGNLTIDDGARVLTEHDLVVGEGQLGKGYVTVRGKNTYYEAGTVSFGRQAGDLGRLQILSGAGMKVLGQLTGGESGNSEVLVANAGALLDIVGDMNLGSSNDSSYTSTVRVEQAGALKVQGAINTSSVGVSEITVTGNNATLSATSIAFGDDSLGAGNGTSSLTVDNNGLVQTSTVTLGKSAGSTGNLILNGNAQGRGVLEANQILKGDGAANLEVNGGVLRAASSSADLLAQFPSFTFGAEGMGLDTNGHNLTVNTNFAGAATAGAVGLIKQGEGALTLTGNSTFAGTSMVEQGLLLPATATALGTGAVSVGGAGHQAQLRLDLGISIANAIEVKAQGLLSGSGAVGATTVAAGGTINPGAARADMATLTINGNLVMQPGSTYQVALDPNSAQSDLLAVVGDADIAGGSLRHLNINGGYDLNRRYTILTATGQVIGEFADTASELAFLDVVPVYDDAQKVEIFLQRNAYDFTDLALTPNQKATAKAIDGMDPAGAVYKHIESLPVGAPPAVFDSLSGEVHASVKASLTRAANSATQTSLQQMRSNLAGVANNCSARRTTAQPSLAPNRTSCNTWAEPMPAWVQVVGDWSKVKSDGNAAQSKATTSGLFIGIDEELAGSGWRLGGALGYTKTDLKLDERNSSADIASYSASLYTGKSFALGGNWLNVLGGASYTHHSASTDRTIDSLAQRQQADYSGRTAQLFGEVGYAMALESGHSIEPFAGLTVSQQRVAGFEEDGGFAGLRANSSSQTRTSSTLGIRSSNDFKLGGKDLLLKTSLGWKHAWGSRDIDRTMSFKSGSPDFTIAGVAAARNTGVLGLQAEIALSRSSTLELGYQGEFAGGVRDQAAAVKMRWAF